MESEIKDIKVSQDILEIIKLNNKLWEIDNMIWEVESQILVEDTDKMILKLLE